MRLYLVLANMTSEFVPIRMFTDNAEAMEFAKQLYGVPPEMADLWPSNFCTLHDNNLVVEFVDGRPVGAEVFEVYEYEDI
jgi:hypothetical protein